MLQWQMGVLLETAEELESPGPLIKALRLLPRVGQGFQTGCYT